MLNFFPLSVVPYVKNTQIVPKLEACNRVADKGGSELIFGVDQGVLRVHLILGLGARQFCQKVLFFDAAFSELDANFTDLVSALGLVESSPTVANLDLNFVLLVG